MKKSKKALAILLSAAFSLGALASCSGDGGNGKADKNIINPVVSINAFESQKELGLLNIRNTLGKITLNDTDEFVASGDRSAKVTVIHDPWQPNDSPSLFQPMNILARELDCTDFSVVSAVTVKVFNAEKSERRLGFQLVYPSGTGTLEWYSLQPERWTDISYSVTRELLPAVVSSGETKYAVDGVSLFFDRPSDKDDVYYLDDIELHKTAKEFTPLVQTLDRHEICSFDKAWQMQGIETASDAGDTHKPVAEFVKDCVSPYSANHDGSALRISTNPEKIEVKAGVFESVSINASILRKADLSEYTDDDMLCFDMYVPNNSGVTKIYMGIRASDGYGFFSRVMCSPEKSGTKELVRGEWHTYKIPVSVLNSEGGTNYPAIAGRRDFAHAVRLAFSYRLSEDADIVFYLDNIRMEKAAQTTA